jgi:hypothetical protein
VLVMRRVARARIWRGGFVNIRITGTVWLKYVGYRTLEYCILIEVDLQDQRVDQWDFWLDLRDLILM